MLGEQIGESRGKIIGQRLLSTDPPKLEISFQAKGKIRGVETNDIVTYSSVLRPDGTLFGEGDGVSMAADGQVLKFKGTGVGYPTGEGLAATFRGAIYYSTTADKFLDLNRIAVVYEYDIDSEGNTVSRAWEWK